jgi:hypothetical protein
MESIGKVMFGAWPPPSLSSNLEFGYSVQGKMQGIITVTGDSLKDAAKDVARKLKTVCEAYEFAVGTERR